MPAMTLTLMSKLPRYDKVFFDPGFMSTMESHLAYLASHQSTTTVQLDPLRVQVHLGDFYGMLSEIGIEQNLHWIIARLNGMHSPSEFDETVTSVLVPDRAVIDRIRISYATIVHG
jgi:hypothetical protein